MSTTTYVFGRNKKKLSDFWLKKKALSGTMVLSDSKKEKKKKKKKADQITTCKRRIRITGRIKWYIHY